MCWNCASYSLGCNVGKMGVDKLGNVNNFGNGAVKYQVQTVQISKDLTVDSLVQNGCDIFHLGVNIDDGEDKLTNPEISDYAMEQLKAWAKMSASHVILSSQNYILKFGDYGPATEGNTNPMTSTPLGRALDTNGPFGPAHSFNQGGSWQGTLSTLDEDACVLVREATGKPIMVMDREYGSVFVSDCGILTDYGGMTSGSALSSVNDIMFANLYAFLIGIVCYGPPETCDFETDPFTICVED